jgi:hypothetical protein
MAQHRLGNARLAREHYERANRWIGRRTRIARIRRDYRDAWILLQAEVLRREAEALLFAGTRAMAATRD